MVKRPTKSAVSKKKAVAKKSKPVKAAKPAAKKAKTAVKKVAAKKKAVKNVAAPVVDPKLELTKVDKLYVRPGMARFVERHWQEFVASRPVFTVESYANIRTPSAIEEIIPCMLCGSNHFRHVMTPAKKDWKYDVVMCTECDLLFRNPNVIPEHLHVLYDTKNYNNFLTSKYGGAGRQAKYKSVLMSFEDIIPRKGPLKVLDFGCGNGLFLEIAKERGYEGWGVDLSPESIEHAKVNLGHNRLWCGDLDKIPDLKDEKFDLITLWSVLAHLPRPIDTFKMLRSFLKPGGKLLVFTVNANSMLLKHTKEDWNGFTRNHLAFFSPTTARNLFRKAGFSQVHSRPHYANVQTALRNKLTEEQWQAYKTNVLEMQGGNMNRFVAVN